MTDWASWRDRPVAAIRHDGEAIASRILRVVLASPAPTLSTVDIAALLGDVCGNRVSTYCRQLERRGYLARTMNNRRRPVNWRATDLLLEVGIEGALRPRVEQQIVAAVDAGARTLSDLSEQVGASRAVIVCALHRLAKKGAVTLARKDGQTIVTADADDWTPAPYVNPIRARALGLTVGGRQ